MQDKAVASYDFAGPQLQAAGGRRGQMAEEWGSKHPKLLWPGSHLHTPGLPKPALQAASHPALAGPESLATGEQFCLLGQEGGAEVYRALAGISQVHRHPVSLKSCLHPLLGSAEPSRRGGPGRCWVSTIQCRNTTLQNTS